ncbi:MAG TPA: hypothetical protein VFN28_14315 [Amaricoccus sp.]|nr:hypothetical protein [Amaricoccus sp.]
MDATRTMAAGRSASPEGTPRGTTETARPGRARARAYLDLWERNLVHVALHGPEPRPELSPEASPEVSPGAPAGAPSRSRQPA